MARKNLSITELTNSILTSTLYLEKGSLIVIYNNTKRVLFPEVAFFELVFQGEDLYLNFSKLESDTSYTERVNLSTVNNINGILINAEN